MGDQYCLLGPYKEQCARTEVEEQEFPAGSPLQIAVSRMRDQGYQVCSCQVQQPIFIIVFVLKMWFLQLHTGAWLVDGNPQLILFDIGSGAWKLDEYKQELWDKTGVGIPHLDIETNDAIILGYMVAAFIAEVQHVLVNKINTVWKCFQIGNLFLFLFSFVMQLRNVVASSHVLLLTFMNGRLV